jgi:lipopolysaccharide export system permease protein
VSKLTDDLSRAELLQPSLAAWLPVLLGGMAGFLVLLHQEDG